MSNTDFDSISGTKMESAFQTLKTTFASGATVPVEWRKTQLKNLRKGLKESQVELIAALQADLGRHEVECVNELLASASEADFALASIDKWITPTQVPAPAMMPDTNSTIYSRPKGVVLIISPFNFPFHLALCPLIGAIAAGNCAVVKPSELTPHVAAAMQKFCEKYLDQSAIRVMQGGVEETTGLLKLPFDHFCYTGNGRVGRIVMKAAAEQLAGCTLELGGKSPVYIHEDANLEIASKRIIAGKFTNDGQMCISPDYIIVHEKVRDELIRRFKDLLPIFYGQNKDNKTRLVNHHHFDRVSRMLGESHGGQVVEGGLEHAKREIKFIPPTIVVDPSPNSMMMTEEIFGPIIPVVTVKSFDQALTLIRKKENPLAGYVFTQTPQVAQEFMSKVPCGGGCVNDVVTHIRNKNLPFGGSGPSGIGSQNGKFSFDAFSHSQSVMEIPANKDGPRFYPPFSAKMAGMLKSAL